MLRSSVVVTAIAIAGYLVSFGNQLLIANLFGASVRLDAYLVAISVPFLFMAVMSGVFSYSFVPILVQKRVDGASQYAQFASLLFALVVLLAVLAPTAAFFVTPSVVKLLVPGYSVGLQADVLVMSRVMWIACSFAIVGGYLVALNNAAKQFFIPVLTNVFPYIGMIGVALFMGHQIGPMSLVLGMLAGSFVAIPLLYWRVRTDLTFDASVLSVRSHLVPVFRRMPLVLFSMMAVAIYGTIDAIWVSRLGESHLSHLAYGQRLLISMGNAILLGPMTVLLPYLSEAAALDHWEEFRAQTLRAMRMLVFYFSVVTVIFSVVRVPVVRLLFERGEFSRVTTLGVSSTITGLSLGMISMITVILLLRAFYATGDIKGAALISGVGAVTYFLLSGLLSKLFGLQGVIVAYFIAWTLSLVLAVGRLWHGKLDEIANAANWTFAWQLALALVVCGTLTGIGNEFFVGPAMDSGGVKLGMALAFASGLGVISFLAITARVFQMQEVTLLLGLLPAMRRKNAAQRQL